MPRTRSLSYALPRAGKQMLAGSSARRNSINVHKIIVVSRSLTSGWLVSAPLALPPPSPSLLPLSLPLFFPSPLSPLFSLSIFRPFSRLPPFFLSFPSLLPLLFPSPFPSLPLFPIHPLFLPSPLLPLFLPSILPSLFPPSFFPPLLLLPHSICCREIFRRIFRVVCVVSSVSNLF